MTGRGRGRHMENDRATGPVGGSAACGARGRTATRRGLLFVTFLAALAALRPPRAGADDAPRSLRDGQVTPEARAFWSFQPLGDPAAPAGDGADGTESEIDRFLHPKRRAAGIVPAGPADRRTLIRRVTFDLTGLPPTP